MVLDSEKYSPVGKGKFPQHLPGELQNKDYDEQELSAW